jgi:toxin ParE1/3/4
MAYLINIAARAASDLEGIYLAIDAEQSDSAFRWFEGLQRVILTLERIPNRCPVTSESRDLRHLLYGKKPHVYRVIFSVDDQRKQVEILHIRHGAMAKFMPEEL